MLEVNVLKETFQCP